MIVLLIDRESTSQFRMFQDKDWNTYYLRFDLLFIAGSKCFGLLKILLRDSDFRFGIMGLLKFLTRLSYLKKSMTIIHYFDVRFI